MVGVGVARRINLANQPLTGSLTPFHLPRKQTKMSMRATILALCALSAAAFAPAARVSTRSALKVCYARQLAKVQ